jgi:hypothetical protein
MRASQCLGAAAIAVALSASGCAAVEPAPAGPTQGELAAYSEQTLLAIWLNTGLAETVERPVVTAGEPMSTAEWFDFVMTCLNDRGHTQIGLSWSLSEGAVLQTSSGAVLNDDEAQLDFYECAAQHPLDPAADHTLLSDAELDYIYNYYVVQLVPCIVLNGYGLDPVVSREQFAGLYGQWNPYYAIRQPINLRQFKELRNECGAERPPLE